MEEFIFPVAIDFIVLFAFFALAAFYSLKGDRGIVPAATIALPLAVFSFELAETSAFFADFITSIESQPFTLLAAYGVVFFALFIFLRTLYPTYGENGRPIQSLLSGAALTIMLLVLWSSVPFLREVRELPVVISPYFIAEYTFLWLAASFAALYIAASRP